MKDMTMAKWIGLALKIVLAVMVAALLGSETMNFANFITPPDKWYIAYTIFGLTMGAFAVYLYLLLKDAETSLQKTVALIMTGVGLIGELATAGFGMQIEGWKKMGWALTPADYDFMILAIRIIMLVHGLALLLYWFGDRIFEIIEEASGKDINKDGRIGKNKGSNQRPAYTQTDQQPQHTLDEFLAVTGMTRQQAQTQFKDRDQFMRVASGKFDYVSGGNLRRMYGELMNGQNADPTRAAR